LLLTWILALSLPAAGATLDNSDAKALLTNPSVLNLGDLKWAT
jgi:hypothetical protein